MQRWPLSFESKMTPEGSCAEGLSPVFPVAPDAIPRQRLEMEPCRRSWFIGSMVRKKTLLLRPVSSVCFPAAPATPASCHVALCCPRSGDHRLNPQPTRNIPPTTHQKYSALSDGRRRRQSILPQPQKLTGSEHLTKEMMGSSCTERFLLVALICQRSKWLASSLAKFLRGRNRFF